MPQEQQNIFQGLEGVDNTAANSLDVITSEIDKFLTGYRFLIDSLLKEDAVEEELEDEGRRKFVKEIRDGDDIIIKLIIETRKAVDTRRLKIFLTLELSDNSNIIVEADGDADKYTSSNKEGVIHLTKGNFNVRKEVLSHSDGSFSQGAIDYLLETAPQQLFIDLKTDIAQAKSRIEI